MVCRTNIRFWEKELIYCNSFKVSDKIQYIKANNLHQNTVLIKTNGGTMHPAIFFYTKLFNDKPLKSILNFKTTILTTLP